MEGITDIAQLLQIPKDVVIFSHRNPDGDALGSSLALKLFLESYGQQVSVIMPSDFPSAMSFLPGSDDVLIFDFDAEHCIKKILKANIMFFLDFSSLDRIDKIAEYIIDNPATKIHIDHHIDPEPFADYVLSDTKASSTAELVFDFIHELGASDRLTRSIAECLLTGIITDTGSFKYSSTRKTFEIAGALLDQNVNLNELQDTIYNKQEEKVIRLLGHCLANRMEIIPDLKTGIIWLTKQDYKDFDIQRGDTEGIVNYLMKINKVEIAALITEQPTIIKLSLRSKGDISVQ